MLLLAEFLLRLCFGMAAAMATVSPRQVSSGYFRNHLYVTLGLASLAALLSRSQSGGAFWWAVFAAGLSYAGSVSWLYESPRAGIAALVLTALVAMVAAWYAATEAHAPQSSMAPTTPTPILRDLQIVTSGLLLGATMAAMLLGHWYLNAPGMQLAPLRRLIVAMGAAAAMQAAVCGCGLSQEAAVHHGATAWWLFLTLRWLFGLAGVAALAVMAWKTLAIPNTQSATGILYVAVIGAFVGETMSLLLSAEATFPV